LAKTNAKSFILAILKGELIYKKKRVIEEYN